MALLDGITATPAQRANGWHPLPSRVSFAPRNILERIRYLLNPSRKILVNYEPDNEWTYDVAMFEAPSWHETFQDPCQGFPVHDVDIKVCHVPDILCADFFAALAECSDNDHLIIFNDAVVTGAIEHVWWTGACRVDTLQVFFVLWGLALLVYESSIIADCGELNGQPVRHAESRQLRHVTGPSGSTALPSINSASGCIGRIPVSAAFLGAKGLVDVLHELLQFAGCVSIGRGSDYLNSGNVSDLIQSGLLIMLIFESTSTAIRILVIFICWWRVMEIFTSAENIAIELQPIKRLARSLIPASMMTLLCFGAFSHAFYFVWGTQQGWRNTFFRSFATLITTELPTNPARTDPIELAITYVAVLFFSIFILNIFIGVISSQYEKEKEHVLLSFTNHRAHCCLNFLLRARVLPCRLCSKPLSWLITIVAACAALATQVVSLSHGRPRGTTIAFIVTQSIMLMAAYQNPTLPLASCWSCAAAQKKHYLWLTCPHSNCDDASDIEEGVQQMVEPPQVMAQALAKPGGCDIPDTTSPVHSW
jgi:hypothetical protein